MFWQENTHVDIWFQQSCFVTLLKSRFGMPLSIWCIFSERLFTRTPMAACVCLVSIKFSSRVILFKQKKIEICHSAIYTGNFLVLYEESFYILNCICNFQLLRVFGCSRMFIHVSFFELFIKSWHSLTLLAHIRSRRPEVFCKKRCS